MNLLWLQVGLILPLSGFLVWKQRQRREIKRRKATKRLDGHGIATTELRTRRGNLSQRHWEISHECRRATAAEEEYGASFKKSLYALGFFRDSDHSAPEQTTRWRDHSAS